MNAGLIHTVKIFAEGFAPFGQFARLKRSKFRSRFHLSEADRSYIAGKGIDTIRRHCEDFIRTRLAPANPPNDGKQTPMRGHPVFKAQHACACCCRDCLAKWWKVPRGVAIPAEMQHGIVDFLMAWIEQEYERMSVSGQWPEHGLEYGQGSFL